MPKPPEVVWDQSPLSKDICSFQLALAQGLQFSPRDCPRDQRMMILNCQQQEYVVAMALLQKQARESGIRATIWLVMGVRRCRCFQRSCQRVTWLDDMYFVIPPYPPAGMMMTINRLWYFLYPCVLDADTS